MNKEFRVWIDALELGKFIYPESITFNKDGSIETPEYRGGIVQQWTGLTDSTGRKIFEGDIIVESDTRYNDLPYEIKYCRHGYSQILAFHPVSKNNDHLNYHYGEWHGKEVVVIGNIFENPELLKP